MYFILIMIIIEQVKIYRQNVGHDMCIRYRLFLLWLNSLGRMEGGWVTVRKIAKNHLNIKG